MTWTADEVKAIAAAVSLAPSVHNTQPWLLEFGDDDVRLIERTAVRLPEHDPTARDRLISCGAALTNLRVAVRRLGWLATWAQFPDPRPAVVAAVRRGRRLPPTAWDIDLHRAISRRHSHRHRFAGPVPAADLRELTHALSVPGTQARAIADDEVRGLADLLTHTALVYRDDTAYLRELAGWSSGDRQPDGMRPESRDAHTLPWSGLVDASTRVPDAATLADRLAAEGLLVVLTVGDGHSDHLNAGAALEEVWLAATARGYAASVLTQPLHLPEVRAGLIERAELAGWPQALLRLGLPAVRVPPSPRRPLTDLVVPRGEVSR